MGQLENLRELSTAQLDQKERKESYTLVIYSNGNPSEL
jgi:hypothetical protein